MKYFLTCCAITFVIPHLAHSQTQRPIFVDSTYGFSMVPPAFGADTTSPSDVAAMFFASTSNGFAANLNVSIQNIVATPEMYLALSKAQYTERGMKLNSSENLKIDGHDALLLDYEGQVNNRNLHFLALAIFEKNRVYLLTGTARSEDFPKYATQFRASIMSFRSNGR